MAGEEEYEIMPHRTIENIKKELEELKLKAASKEAVSNEEFKKSLDNLSVSINGLMNLFKQATEEMKVEEETDQELKEKIGPLIKKMENLEAENKSIAKAILAVADLVEERVPKQAPQPRMRPIPPPKIIQPQAPRHSFEPQSLDAPTFGAAPKPMPVPPAQAPMPAPQAPPIPPAAPPLPQAPMPKHPQELPPLPPGPRPPHLASGPLPPIGPPPAPEKKGLGFLSKIFKK